MRIAKKVSSRLGFIGALVLTMVLLAVTASSASAAAVWNVESFANPTAAPGGQLQFAVMIKNVGDTSAPASLGGEDFGVTATFPVGLTPVEVESEEFTECTIEALTNNATCSTPGSVEQIKPRSRRSALITLEVDPGALGKTLTATVEASGGEATPDTTVDPTLIEEGEPQFGIAAFDTQTFADAASTAHTQAGGHPYAYSAAIEFNAHTGSNPYAGALLPVEQVRDIFAELPAGFIGNPTAVDQCTTAELANMGDSNLRPHSLCPSTSQVGTTLVRTPGSSGLIAAPPSTFGPLPIFNIVPPPGVPARLGFNIAGSVIMLDASLRSDGDYGLTVAASSIPEALAVQASQLTLWGVPSDEDHDLERACPGELAPWDSGPHCDSGAPPLPFFRFPTACETPEGSGLVTRVRADSWADPGDFDSLTHESHLSPGFPYAPEDWGALQGQTGCEKVPVKGNFTAQSTSIDAETASGLEIEVEIPNPGFDNPTGIASSDIKASKLTLPEGMTLNPAVAEGLGVCAPAEYESTELSFHPDGEHGCPTNSKIGTLEVDTPLLEERLEGDIYVAQQDDPATITPGAENPFDSLIALYFVLENPERGVLVKQPAKVEPDPKTGQLVISLDDIPQVPFDSFRARLREGARSPLVTPPSCGTYESKLELTGWSAPDTPITRTSSFQIVRGIGGGPCPPGGVPPFGPRFEAGSINNNAGSYSPFYMRLTRNDGEQNMTKFSSILPPGVLGSLAGISKCSDSAVAFAKSKTGKQELASPSCPANSEIGRTLAGAGVGSVFANARGKIYLGGPYKGRPLSVIAITPAVSGPFDAGTVVVQLALTLNPKTAEVEVDGAASDPIPHILQGIVLKVRDLRVYVDRPNFIINPTSCDPSSAKATIFGSFLDIFDPADDQGVPLSDRYQAANCATLGFKPKLALNLKGGTKRGAHPGLRAIYTPRPGDANVEGLVVRLPRSAFLDQAHIRTICTRVQFAADACPPAAQYGYIKAWTPLLDEPLQGPVWLRSSDNKLPDLVFDLKGLVDIEVATRIDSIRGGVRATLTDLPDAPLSKVVLRMQGAKKGLIVNSRNLCTAKSRANVAMDGQNGKISDFNPVLKPDCAAKAKLSTRSGR